MIQILLVNNQQLINEGLKQVLNNEPDFEAESIICSEQALVAVKEGEFDVYVIGFLLSEESTLRLVTEINRINPNAKILVYTAEDFSFYYNSYIVNGVGGVMDYSCTPEQIIQTIKLALDGQSILPSKLLGQIRLVEREIVLGDGDSVNFTEMELNVLTEVSKGGSTDYIADRLLMSKRSVEYYLTKIYIKLDVKTRVEAIHVAREVGLLPKVLSF